MPSRALLDAVARYIAPRRLVTSEMRVVPPRYRRVAVHATLHVACGAEAAAGRGTGARAHRRLLRSADRRPRGRRLAVRPRRLPQRSAWRCWPAIDGVERVTEFGFKVGAAAKGDVCDNVVLCANELVRPGRHRLRSKATPH